MRSGCLALLAAVATVVATAALAPASASASLKWSPPILIDPTVTPPTPPISGSPTSVSCPTESFCVVVDYYGSALTYDCQQSCGWSKPVSIADWSDLAVSCASPSFCVAVDNGGYAHYYDGTSWTSGQNTISGGSPTSVSCPVSAFEGSSSAWPSAAFCAAVDASGNAMIFDCDHGCGWYVPPVKIDPGHVLASVSCASASFCAAVDTAGRAMMFDGSSWTAPTPIGYQQTLQSVSCPVAWFCAAVDGSGHAIFYDRGTWNSPVLIDKVGGPLSVSCESVFFCVVVDNAGNAVIYQDGTWSAPVPIYAGHPLRSVSCPSASFCMTVGGYGYAVSGSRPPQHTLFVSLAGAGSGTVTGAGISCPGTCSQSYDEGGAVTLTAKPAAGSTFAGWAGGGCSGTGPCTVTMNSAQSVIATFNSSPALPQYTLTVSLAGPGWGTVTGTGISCPGACSHSYPQGTVVTLSATPAVGSTFSGWAGGGCSATGPCAITMTSDQTVKATFAIPPPPPPAGAVSSASAISTTSGGTATATNAGTTVTGTGQGALTVSQYGSNPAGQPSFSAAGQYFDVKVAAGSSFSSLTIVNCNLGGGTTIAWWNGSAWLTVSPQSYTAGPPACATATLGQKSTPTIAQLTGTVFAATLRGTATAGAARVRGTSVSVPIRCTGGRRSRCAVKLTLRAKATIKDGRVIAVTTARKTSASTRTKVVLLGTAAATLTAGHSQTLRVSLNRSGKRLLATHHTLKAKLTITQSGRTIRSRTITFTTKPKR